MMFGIVFVLIFIIGFAVGIAMPFILFKYPFKITKGNVETKEPASTVNEIMDEWLNGKQGD